MKTRMHHLHPRREPADKDIRRTAYFLWEEAGRPFGRDKEFWFGARERLRHAVPVYHLPTPAAWRARNAQPGWPAIR